MAIAIISVIGWHNAGKTSFLVRLIAELKRRGLRVATIKHSRDDFEIDRPGSDTWRLARAGADVVVISGKRRMALIEHRSQEDGELSLDELVGRLPGDIDLVITEGYKSQPTPKILVVRSGVGEGPMPMSGELLALVTEGDMLPQEGVPRFAPEDAAGVADLLMAKGFIELGTE